MSVPDGLPRAGTPAGEWSAHAATLASLVPRAVHPAGGFGWLSPTNSLALERGVDTWITCRMTHVAALALLRGDPDTDTDQLRHCLDVGHDALAAGGLVHDDTFGGWFSRVHTEGADVVAVEGAKAAYAHAFVVLAAASLTAAGHDGGPRLLEEALQTFEQRFWDEQAGMAREQWDRDWSTCEDYRGVNANMHTVEAMLAAGDILGDASLTERARRIVATVVEGFAARADWRLPEHYDSDWNVALDYNRDKPGDPFRPFGVTIGHVLEWARLAVNVAAAPGTGEQSRAALLAAAAAMFEAGVSRGWSVDGAPGFVYTTDFTDEPVVRERLHWVLCEAFATASALAHATGDSRYEAWREEFWAYARTYLIDTVHGGWVHELTPQNQPSSSIWWGKPDLYHAYQAVLVPSLPAMVSFAGALSRVRG